MSKTFEELFEKRRKQENPKIGSLLKGTIVSFNREYAIINVGLQSEGFISLDEFKNSQGELEIAEGDVVEVALKSIDDGLGNTLLSYVDAKRIKLWQSLEVSMNSKEIVAGRVTGIVKGGLSVNIGELKAFLPDRLVDIHLVKGFSHLVGQEILIVVVQMDEVRGRIVVSRRAVMQKDDSISHETLSSVLQKGAAVDGTVVRFSDYGAFVNLGTTDGLLHVKDISWTHIDHPSEKLTIGDKIRVLILDNNESNGRISLGLKQQTPSPISSIHNKYKVGSVVSGTVKNIVDYGIFVSIEDGISGLVHESKMDQVFSIDKFKKGQNVRVKIINIEKLDDDYRISLSMEGLQKYSYLSHFGERKLDLSSIDNFDYSKFVKEYKIFIDTCSLMMPNSSILFESLAKALKKENKKIFIAFKVLQELEGLKKNELKSTKLAAESGYKIYLELEKENCVEVRGELDDPYVDELFQHLFMKFRQTHKLCLITQDRKLALDILDLGNSRSTGISKFGKPMIKGINVLRVDRNNKLSEFSDIDNGKPIINPIKSPQTAKPFKKNSNIYLYNEKSLNISDIPKIGDPIFFNGITAILPQEIASGGEGAVYSIGNAKVCKIYKQGKLNESIVKKLELMMTNQVHIKGICWPKCFVYNSHKEVVGYLMDVARGIELQKSVFRPKFFEKHKPNWDRRDLVKICINILEKIESMHRLNVIIGDINGLNIILNDDLQVYFVDTDSFQIEGFACSVGQTMFTAPEIQKKDFKGFLRTVEHESFSVATLMFMILMPGKPPYSHQGGGTTAENIGKGQFSYPFNGRNAHDAPPGRWRFIWSHFPYKLKEYFFNSFDSGSRINVKECLRIMKLYLKGLESGYHDIKILSDGYKTVTAEMKEKYNRQE